MIERIKHVMGKRWRFGGFSPPTSFPGLSESDQETVRKFAELYYRQWPKRGTLDLSWMGHKTLKCPTDLWAYQEIVCELGVTYVIETGTRFGGSAYFFACLFDVIGKGRVTTIDVGKPGNVDIDGTQRPLPKHPRVDYVTGSSVDPKIVQSVASNITPQDRVMVVLDSDHAKDHVLAELSCYAPMVTPGSYLIVEDTNLNGHPVLPEFGPGPHEAVDAFLAENKDFTIDRSRERFMLTMNPGGFLRKKC